MKFTHRVVKNLTGNIYAPRKQLIEEIKRPELKITHIPQKDWNFTGCKNENWLKFIDERITWN